MELTFRDAKPEDAESLTGLACRAKASWGYPEAWLHEWRPQLSFSSGYIDKNSVTVAVADDSLVGVVALEDGGEPEIGHLWITPEYQGRGVGGQLIKRALEVAKGRGWGALRIESDPNALPFYKRLGAVPVGEVQAPVCGTDPRENLLLERHAVSCLRCGYP